MNSNNPWYNLSVNNQIHPQIGAFQPLGQSRLNWGRNYYFAINQPYSSLANYPVLNYPHVLYNYYGLAWPNSLPSYFPINSGFSPRGLQLILISILILVALDIIIVRPLKRQG